MRRKEFFFSKTLQISRCWKNSADRLSPSWQQTGHTQSAAGRRSQFHAQHLWWTPFTHPAECQCSGGRHHGEQYRLEICAVVLFKTVFKLAWIRQKNLRAFYFSYQPYDWAKELRTRLYSHKLQRQSPSACSIPKLCDLGQDIYWDPSSSVKWNVIFTPRVNDKLGTLPGPINIVIIIILLLLSGSSNYFFSTVTGSN